MSSTTSSFAQVGRRVGYFICLSGNIPTYTITAGVNGWTKSGPVNRYSQNDILQDMGEIAKIDGTYFRKVAYVEQYAGGGAIETHWIVVPGGEYPIPGVDVEGPAPAHVARLG